MTIRIMSILFYPKIGIKVHKKIKNNSRDSFQTVMQSILNQKKLSQNIYRIKKQNLVKNHCLGIHPMY